jgi:hypothetical protein
MYLRNRPRIQVDLPVRAGGFSGSLYTVTNLSSAGGCIEGEAPIGNEGEAVSILLEIEDGKVNADARIINVRQENGWASCGFTFENLSFDDATLIHDFLAKTLLGAFIGEKDGQ